MKEIKFRAWDKVDNVMRFPLSMDVDGRDEKFATAYFPEDTSDNNGFREFEKLELMQYTGLKDINGKEIYEGDILKAISNGDEFIGAVYFEDSQYFGAKDYLGYAVMYGGAEVIGNIYENSELLKGERRDKLRKDNVRNDD